MKEVTIEEKKKVSIEVLKKIHQFCVDNNIQYFLDCGTLLGAIRHNGFIPWDDDIDICMLRKDYETLKKYFNIDGLSLIDYTCPNTCPIPFIKISDNRTCGFLFNKYELNYGVAVDVFPIDDYPNNPMLRKLFFMRQDMLSTLYGFAIACKSINKQKPVRNFIKVCISKILLPRNICKLLNLWGKKYSSDKAKYSGCVVVNPKHNMEITLKENYSKSISHIFEQFDFNIPFGWDSILSSIYGDNYMTPPPENQRETLHTEKYYWKE